MPTLSEQYIGYFWPFLMGVVYNSAAPYIKWSSYKQIIKVKEKNTSTPDTYYIY